MCLIIIPPIKHFHLRCLLYFFLLQLLTEQEYYLHHSFAIIKNSNLIVVGSAETFDIPFSCIFPMILDNLNITDSRLILMFTLLRMVMNFKVIKCNIFLLVYREKYNFKPWLLLWRFTQSINRILFIPGIICDNKIIIENTVM